jgi:hypothetical protein
MYEKTCHCIQLMVIYIKRVNNFGIIKVYKKYVWKGLVNMVFKITSHWKFDILWL